MIRDASELLGLALLFRAFAGGSGSSLAPSSSAPAVPRPPTPEGGSEVPRVRTGEADLRTWFRRRFDLARASLSALGVPADRVDRVALSLLAQWAHETARGRAEFNFNLGGWRARRGESFHTARDVQTPGQPTFRWSAYSDLGAAIDDQIRRLASIFAVPWAYLIEEPESSAWVEELGRRGYYTAPPGDYARAWAMHRTELGGLQ